MVLGLYGVLFLEVARAPERGFLIAPVGMAGKVLGPAGLAWLILTGTWPVASVVLVATNHLICGTAPHDRIRGLASFDGGRLVLPSRTSCSGGVSEQER